MSDLLTLPDGRTVTWRFDATLDTPAIRVTFAGADGTLQGTDLRVVPTEAGARLQVMGIQSIDEDRGIRVYFHEDTFTTGDDGSIYARDFAPGFAPLPETISREFHLFPQTGASLLTLESGQMLYGAERLSAVSETTFLPDTLFPTSFLDRIFPYSQDIAETGDGGVVWATMSRSAPFDATPVQVHLFDSDLDAVSTKVGVGSDLHRANTSDLTSSVDAVSVTTLADGRIAVAWTSERYATADRSGDPQNGVFLSILNPDLSVALPEVQVTPDGAQVQEKPQVYALDAGGFALAFQNRQQGNSAFSNDMVIQTYDATGRRVAEETISRASGGPGYGFDTEDLVVSPDGTTFLLGQTEVVTFEDRPAAAGPAMPSSGDDLLEGGPGADRIDGLAGDDTINGGDGNDTLIGGEGDDVITGGVTSADLRDLIYGGAGNDTIDGGYGNDELRGDAGNDNIAGGFGADTVIGGAGNDTLTGSAFGDEIFGGDGMDFVNGGFGSDRVNGGAGADSFFHLGIADHGSDWIQDYSAADGDVLVFGGAATADQFQINQANTASAGDAGTDEAFVIYRPTGQIIWALVDGMGEAAITLRAGGVEFDLMG
ncbi:calcium-binding protein [Jannaschia sp. 2305UL9-9]|uniref:calcium-binding protein n=1 Tax=Jannaschia sp. 2305UL9-9 TaxID=3121638 RepID=UPI0035281656